MLAKLAQHWASLPCLDHWLLNNARDRHADWISLSRTAIVTASVTSQRVRQLIGRRLQLAATRHGRPPPPLSRGVTSSRGRGTRGGGGAIHRRVITCTLRHFHWQKNYQFIFHATPIFHSKSINFAYNIINVKFEKNTTAVTVRNLR